MEIKGKKYEEIASILTQENLISRSNEDLELISVIIKEEISRLHQETSQLLSNRKLYSDLSLSAHEAGELKELSQLHRKMKEIDSQIDEIFVQQDYCKSTLSVIQKIIEEKSIDEPQIRL